MNFKDNETKGKGLTKEIPSFNCQYHHGTVHPGHIFFNSAICSPLRVLSLLFRGWALPAGPGIERSACVRPEPRHVATTNALIMQEGQLVQVIGPPILALMVSMGSGWQSALWLLAGSAAIGVVLSLVLAGLENY